MWAFQKKNGDGEVMSWFGFACFACLTVLLGLVSVLCFTAVSFWCLMAGKKPPHGPALQLD
jgi:hypothetical protein